MCEAQSLNFFFKCLGLLVVVGVVQDGLHTLFIKQEDSSKKLKFNKSYVQELLYSLTLCVSYAFICKYNWEWMNGYSL